MKPLTTAHIIAKTAIVLSIVFLFFYMVAWPETMASHASSKLTEILQTNPTNTQLKEATLYVQSAIDGTEQAGVALLKAELGFLVVTILSWAFCAYLIRKAKEDIKQGN